MENNGWKFNNVTFDRTNVGKYYDRQCGQETFWGGGHGNIVGMVSATLPGSGTAILNYGNCYNNIPGGEVNIRLNGHVIDMAPNNTPKKEVKFKFKPGDVLIIEEVNYAILKLNSLNLSCIGEKLTLKTF